MVSRRKASFCPWTWGQHQSGVTSMTRRHKSEDHALPRYSSPTGCPFHFYHYLYATNAQTSWIVLILIFLFYSGCSLVSRGRTRGNGPRGTMERVYHCGQGSCARYDSSCYCICPQTYLGVTRDVLRLVNVQAVQSNGQHYNDT